MGGKLIVVAGAQYGSEGKGAVADHLTRPGRVGANVTAVRVAGPNAGHTVYGPCPNTVAAQEEPTAACEGCDPALGHAWKLRAVPVAAVCNPEALLVVAPGSEVDEQVLRSEVEALDRAGLAASERLMVDYEATLLEPSHIEEEKAAGLAARLGSTAKGIGAARAGRVWRLAKRWGDHTSQWTMRDTGRFLAMRLRMGGAVLIEGTQGYGLGLHAGHYPQCTSSDARALDFLAMADISPWHADVRSFEVWLAARVRPIRVAGNSGPLRGETSWGQLGLAPEHTTVTGKVRRVGEWDPDLVRRAVRANGGTPAVRLAVTMVDTQLPEVAGLESFKSASHELSVKLDDFMARIEIDTRARVAFLGTGPTTGMFRLPA